MIEERYWKNRCLAREIGEAVNASKTADVDVFYLSNKTTYGFNPRGIWIEVEDSLFARELFRLKDRKNRPMFHIVIVKNKDDGKVAILSGGNIQFDFNQVFSRLSGHEGCWCHHNWKYPMLINGGMRHQTATTLNRDTIVGYVKDSAKQRR